MGPILIVIPVIGVLIALSRLWVSGSTKPADDEIDSPSVGAGSGFFNGTNSWMIDQTNRASTIRVLLLTDSQSSDAGASQDCSPGFGSDNSSGDCPCPTDSTSYDAGDSSSFDAGSSN